jgi:hypothetical protein
VSWVVSIPVWGTRYTRTFAQYTVPALRAALEGFTEPVYFIVHTDAPEHVKKALEGFRGETHPVGAAPTYVTLQESHADAINRAAIGDNVVLLNADLVVSNNLFTRCREHFAAGRRAVVLTGIRTNLEDAPPPIGAPPRALLEWAWEHRHQIIKDLEWGRGTSMLPTNLFFTHDGSVVARGFHLHPVAIVKHAAIAFKSTIDGDLLEHFAREEIHVVTSPDDLAMLEMSPRERRFPVRPGRNAVMTPDSVARAMRTRASKLHRWLFTHRIVITGTGEKVNDVAPAKLVLKGLGEKQLCLG